MRGADSWAGTIKSGGKTRRAAKMVVLDIDHPDIEDFIWCKAKEEKKAEALRQAGFDMSIDGDGFTSIQYQNANNSVRITDAFMEAVEADGDWDLIARNGGETTKTVQRPRSARPDLRGRLAVRRSRRPVRHDHQPLAHLPGVGADQRLEPVLGVHARRRLGLQPGFDQPDEVPPRGRLVRRDRSSSSTVDVVFLAQEIVVSPSSYPTEKIGENARAFRQLGLGYANLGALLMSDGVPYDSDEGRNIAGAITALMTGRGYRKSAEIAAAVGTYEAYPPNREAHNSVMRMHRDASYKLDADGVKGDLVEAAQRSWDDAVELGEEHGYRNAQATVLAPTGTISFLMDCDTTGIEPDFSLVKFKELVGGGSMTIVNRTVPMALDDARLLGDRDRADRGLHQRQEHDRRRAGAQGRAPARLRRRCRRAGDQPHGPHQDDGRGPAVPLGSDLEDGQPAADGDGRGHRGRLQRGLEARPEGARDLPRRLEDGAGAAHRRAGLRRGGGCGRGPGRDARARHRMPAERESITHKFSIGGHEGYITAGKYEDGSVGEIFLTDIGKEGSTIKGLMNAFATAISIGLQYGVPLETFVNKFAYIRFEPEGITRNPEIPFAKSLPDYIMRWLASSFLDADYQEELGIITPEVRARKEAQQTLFVNEGPAPSAPAEDEERPRPSRPTGTATGPTATATVRQAATAAPKVSAPTAALTDTPPVRPARMSGLELGPACEQCGGMMQRTGSCYTCSSCGNNTGCG